MNPTDSEVLACVQSIRVESPGLGAAKLLARMRTEQSWSISEKRLRKILNPPTLSVLVPETHLDPTLDVSALATKVSVELFGGVRGKGLVAKERIEQGEVIWQENPWIPTADP